VSWSDNRDHRVNIWVINMRFINITNIGTIGFIVGFIMVISIKNITVMRIINTRIIGITWVIGLRTTI
jgi:hypothetical protein